MIVEWFLDLVNTVGAWLISLFPVWTPPEFFVQLDTKVNAFFAGFEGLGVWADWAYLGIVVGSVLAVWLLGLTIKLFRAAASYVFPGWGSG